MLTFTAFHGPADVYLIRINPHVTYSGDQFQVNTKKDEKAGARTM